jgi:hypothetical protein
MKCGVWAPENAKGEHMNSRLALVAAALVSATSANAVIYVSYEAPGVQNTTAQFSSVGVETFDSRTPSRSSSFNTTFGNNGQISGRYSNVQVNRADQYGGAGGTGNYAVTFNGGGYNLSLTTTNAKGNTYFGYWLSALDRNNNVEFMRDGQRVFLFSPNDVLQAIGSDPAYRGNPNANFAGRNRGEDYAFINVYFTGGNSFDSIHFFQGPGGGYESDNHTIGTFTVAGGSFVPEPATWAMLITGFGMVGYAMRRRRRERAGQIIYRF